MSTGERPPRRYDIDWRRIAAVLLLIPYHTSRVFNTGEQFYAKNVPESPGINRFIGFIGPWHMSLLFLLAGASTWFALGFRGGGRDAGARARGLSFFSQYGYFWTHTDPDLTRYAGTWTPGHLWFILFLLLFSLLVLPLFLWLRPGGRRLIDWFARACRAPGVIAVPARLLALFKDVDLMEVSGQNMICYVLLFVFGFVIVADERVTAAIGRQWPWLLAAGVAGMAVRSYPHPGSPTGRTRRRC
jgi:glucan biosynthesis protein C